MKNIFSIGRTAVSVFLSLALVLTQVGVPQLSSVLPGPTKTAVVFSSHSSCLAPELNTVDEMSLLWQALKSNVKNLTLLKDPKLNRLLKIGSAVSVAGLIAVLFYLPITHSPWTDPTLFCAYLGLGGASVFVKPLVSATMVASSNTETSLEIFTSDALNDLFAKIWPPLKKGLKATGKIVSKVFLMALLVLLLTTVVPGLSRSEATDILAKYEIELSAEEQLALEEIYGQPIVQEANQARLKTPLYERILNNPANIRAITDAAYYQQVPSSLIMAVLTTETNTVGMELRQTAEAIGRLVRNKDTTTTGIAEMQLVNAVKLLPRLYSDIMSDPAAPEYIRQALLNQQQGYLEELGEDIFDPEVIGRTDKNGNLVFDKEIADILQDDNISLYLCAMFVKDAMDILHESDPVNFPDPADYNDRSTDLPNTYAAAIQICYIQDMACVLNPENTAVLQKACGKTTVPDSNIYKMYVLVRVGYSLEAIPFIDYLASGHINTEIDSFVAKGNPLTLSSVMSFFYDDWKKQHILTDDNEKFQTLGHAVEGIGNYTLFSTSGDFSVIICPTTWDTSLVLEETELESAV